jgi:hypothetical protein
LHLARWSVCPWQAFQSSFIYNKTSCFEEINFITEDRFSKYTDITTKLNWKLFTKEIKRPSKEAWVWIDKSVLFKSEA